ncbi:MAG TPA: hypothetical protein VFG30_30595 [Polyangiales bacterium]|nr:hypothetical protein [Polyangiales bacterium]
MSVAVFAADFEGAVGGCVVDDEHFAVELFEELAGNPFQHFTKCGFGVVGDDKNKNASASPVPPFAFASGIERSGATVRGGMFLSGP